MSTGTVSRNDELSHSLVETYDIFILKNTYTYMHVYVRTYTCVYVYVFVSMKIS